MSFPVSGLSSRVPGAPSIAPMKTAAERNVLDVDAGREPQPLGGPVRSGAKASGGKVQRAWLRLGGGHSVGKGLPPFRGRSEYDRLN